MSASFRPAKLPQIIFQGPTLTAFYLSHRDVYLIQEGICVATEAERMCCSLAIDNHWAELLRQDR